MLAIPPACALSEASCELLCCLVQEQQRHPAAASFLLWAEHPLPDPSPSSTRGWWPAAVQLLEGASAPAEAGFGPASWGQKVLHWKLSRNA